MAHSAAALAKCERFLTKAVVLNEAELAQLHLMMGEELLETEDVAAALCIRAMIKVADAIGGLKFPGTWTNSRDNAGFDQTQSA